MTIYTIKQRLTQRPPGGATAPRVRCAIFKNWRDNGELVCQSTPPVTHPLKLSKKYKNGQNEAVGGQLNYVEHALVANPKSGFSTVLLGAHVKDMGGSKMRMKENGFPHG